MKLVRLKPFNGKSHKLQSYTCFGIKFVGTKGWYKVDDDVAEYVSAVKQVQDGPDAEFSANAFDVVNTIEEAKAIEEREKKKALRATAENAHKVTRVHAVTPNRAVPSKTMTTKDLPTNFDDLDGTFPDGDMAPRNRAPATVVDGADADDGEAEGDRETSPVDLSAEPDETEPGMLPQPARSKPKGPTSSKPRSR